MIKGIIPLVFSLFIITNFYAQDTNLLQTSTIPIELLHNSNAVVRLNDVHLKIEQRRKMTIVHNRVITVLNEKGLRYIEAVVGYDKYRKIKRIEAKIYDAFGKEIKKIRRKDFIDHSAVDGGTLYSDSRVLFMGYTPISYPFTVNFTYEMETVNTAVIPTWRPYSGYYMSIENDVYTIEDVAESNIRFKTNHFEGYPVKVNASDQLLEFTASEVKAIKPEDHSPNFYKITPTAMVAVENFHYNGIDGRAKNWIEFGDWMQQTLLEGRNDVSEVTKQEIMTLVQGVNDPLERAKLVYKYVQENTRYISVQVGIGGIQPISALEVDKLKYGDCKGLTNYTQALLKIAEVPSYYTVVQAGNEMVDFDPSFASLEQGNHIILAIENEDNLVWVDCTSQIHPFGFIGDFTDNRSVLLVKNGESEIVKTVAYPDSLNTQITNALLNLNNDGSITSKVEIKTNGIQYDSRFVLERESDKNIQIYYKNYWDNINNLEIDSYEFLNDEESVEFTENLNIRARKYATINGDRLIFIPNALNKNSFVPDRYRNRKFPLEIPRGYYDIDVFEISTPKEFVIEAMPENVLIENEFGKYSIRFEVIDNRVIYTRHLLIKKGNYDKSKYASYRNFRKKVSKLDNSIIVLNKN